MASFLSALALFRRVERSWRIVRGQNVSSDFYLVLIDVWWVGSVALAISKPSVSRQCRFCARWITCSLIDGSLATGGVWGRGGPVVSKREDIWDFSSIHRASNVVLTAHRQVSNSGFGMGNLSFTVGAFSSGVSCGVGRVVLWAAAGAMGSSIDVRTALWSKKAGV